MEEGPCRREQAAVIGCGQKDHPSIAEGVLHGFRHVVPAEVAERYLRTAFGAEHLPEPLCRAGRTAMDGGVCHENPFRLNPIAAPAAVEVQIIRKVFPEDGPVERGDDPQPFQGGNLLEQGLDRDSVFPADIEVVAAPFAGPVIIVFPPVARFGQGPELAEGVGAEQDTVLRAVTDHHFRPVDHGSGEKAERTGSEREAVAFFHRQNPLRLRRLVQELRQHGRRLGAEDQLQAGIFRQGPGQEAAVVRFQVMDDQVSRRPSPEGFPEIPDPRIPLPGVHRVQDGDFFIFHKIGIVRHSLRNGILAFKQVERQVVDPDVGDMG